MCCCGCGLILRSAELAAAQAADRMRAVRRSAAPLRRIKAARASVRHGVGAGTQSALAVEQGMDAGRRAMSHMDRYIIPAGNTRSSARRRAPRRRGGQPPHERQLYAGRQKIYPKLAHGRFRDLKWLVMAVTLGIYYVLPWLRWDRGPDLPDQAVLLDMAHNRFFFFFLEIWPQEFYFVTGLLVLAALALFLVTSVAGPRLVRLHLPADGVDRSHDRWSSASGRATATRASASTRQPWGPVKIFKKGMTHLSWLAIGAADRRRLRLLFPRCADARRRAADRHGAGHRLPVPRHLHAHDLSCSAASPASRSASTCARGRASRAP